MGKDLQNILRFCSVVDDVSYIPNLDGTPKAVSRLGIPFDNTDLLPSSIGSTDDFYINFGLPDGLTIISALIKYSDGTTESFVPQYDEVSKTITGFTNNLSQSILIKTA